MRLYSLSAAAKINLYLEIIGDRPDGYHELVMIMQSVDLADRVTVRSLATPDIQIHCEHPQVPNGHDNLAYKAAALLLQKFPTAVKQHGGVEITIEKRIPVGAGLAGGSTNAAAVLVGLDMLWQLGLTQSELQDLGAELGSDVPFCIVGGTAIATGRGEKVDSLYGIDNLYAVLAKYQSLSVSTPWAYQTYRQQFASTYVDVAVDGPKRQDSLRSGPLVHELAKQDGPGIGKHLHNDLEKVVLVEHPLVQELKTTLSACGGLGTLMSGSGPTVFSLAASQSQAEAIAEKLRSRIPNPDLGIWVTRLMPTGVQLIS
ncbi:MAG: 4-(cytidine 5'-diphospho)-2-C-methyl-D-erythritol kinase [Leptolyngbya sp. SIO1D8]|nr:4-(cytidine 5'-diphospho)-2-C-methyl-D-erythritol kinase [Leptolyngbya sp. SIO1D8]